MIIFFYKKLQISTLLFVYEMIWFEEQYNHFNVTFSFFQMENSKHQSVSWDGAMVSHDTSHRQEEKFNKLY